MEELKASIERMYAAFSGYHLNHAMHGCPCCVSSGDKQKIHSKELKELTCDDLSRYSYKAMTTWGNTEDFKHYLPRILELLSTGNCIIDNSIVLGKLEYGKWRTWQEKEQRVIKEFLFAWWRERINERPGFPLDVFLGINDLVGAPEHLLSRWDLSIEGAGFTNFVDFVYEYYYDLTVQKRFFRQLKEHDLCKIVSWIKSNSIGLEEGFFYFESKDEEFAERISSAHFMVSGS